MANRSCQCIFSVTYKYSNSQTTSATSTTFGFCLTGQFLQIYTRLGLVSQNQTWRNNWSRTFWGPNAFPVANRELHSSTEIQVSAAYNVVIIFPWHINLIRSIKIILEYVCMENNKRLSSLTCHQTVPWHHSLAIWGSPFPRTSSYQVHQSPQNHDRQLCSLHELINPTWLTSIYCLTGGQQFRSYFRSDSGEIYKNEIMGIVGIRLLRAICRYCRLTKFEPTVNTSVGLLNFSAYTPKQWGMPLYYRPLRLALPRSKSRNFCLGTAGAILTGRKSIAFTAESQLLLLLTLIISLWKLTISRTQGPMLYTDSAWSTLETFSGDSALFQTFRLLWYRTVVQPSVPCVRRGRELNTFIPNAVEICIPCVDQIKATISS